MLYESNVASLAEKELAPVSLLGVDDPKRHAIRASMHALTWCLATAQEVGYAVLEQDCHDLGFLDF